MKTFTRCGSCGRTVNVLLPVWWRFRKRTSRSTLSGFFFLNIFLISLRNIGFSRNPLSRRGRVREGDRRQSPPVPHPCIFQAISLPPLCQKGETGKFLP